MKSRQPPHPVFFGRGRRKASSRGGWRALTLYILVVVLMGLAVVALGLQLEQRERLRIGAPR